MENRNQGVNAMQAIPNPNAPMNMANPFKSYGNAHVYMPQKSTG